MGSIRHEIELEISADQAWAVLRDVGLAHRLFAGVLVDARLDGDVRTVTFADGLVVRERIVDVSDEHRRLAYAAFEGTPMTHHNASMEVIRLGESRSRFIWIADFLPDDFGGTMMPLIQQGAQALKTNLEGTAFAEPDTAA
jgi:hypothetical protein